MQTCETKNKVCLPIGRSMAGIEKTVEVLADVTQLTVNAVYLVKSIKKDSPVAILSALPLLADIAAAVVEIVKDLPPALPELLDLDRQEVAVIGTASYDLVKKVLDAVKS